MSTLRGGWHTCPTIGEQLGAIAGAFAAGVGLTVLAFTLGRRR